MSKRMMQYEGASEISFLQLQVWETLSLSLRVTNATYVLLKSCY